ncbi:DUF1439 domain-containing protein [Shewanella sp. Isolate11]|uniref:DUF1439 domain-containing protein n=1 Tax=Shewanella sp. Isolate11 TaxID=2908530 RepID=UPI001EFC61D9|nr:DUF1439 domain-containing protein [Shewanella sp. Isolate11]MCG9695341.1 DUF1439 domain-containing protein [Shewanella sp. Isolate11]
MTTLKLFMFVSVLLLTGCVSQYSISEKQLAEYLNDEMHFEVKQGNRLFGIELKVNDVDVILGQKPNTMAILAHSHIKVRNPLMPIDAKLTTQFEAQPWYDSENHSVYLRQLSLTKVESTPKDIEKAIKPVAPQIMAFLTHFLETQPVYVLNTKESNQALIAEMTKRIEVVPGELKLIFTE